MYTDSLDFVTCLLECIYRLCISALQIFYDDDDDDDELHCSQTITRDAQTVNVLYSPS